MIPVKPNFIIELVGLPGSGKSFTARALAAATGAPVLPWRQPRRVMLLGLAAHPLSAWHWFRALGRETRQSRTGSLWRYKIALLGSTFAQAWLARRREPPGPVIMDEGFAQRILSVAEQPQTVAATRTLFLASPPADLIVIIETRPPTFRRHEHQHARAEQGGDYLMAWKEIITANYEVVKQVITESGRPYRYVRSEADREALAEFITRQQNSADTL